MREITQIIIHCSATPPYRDIGADEIREWHIKDNGWVDIGYHYVIRRDGSIDPGRDLDGDGEVDDEVGAHAYGFNRNSIGICLIGGVDSNKMPIANYTSHQYASLHELHEELLEKHPTITSTVGHRDLPSAMKPCPCFDVREFFK